ncbi:hypothetical protein QJS10_CPB18g01895 [Acorus calamus]|uniref:C2 domain-containing protein n=1 Tax=Acorus calamus TaxID=4465 RepID=A0AAV9CPR9_ACOCL|nr:hypothetical protein QJS10_CPB18g01895 [Acorus calamus]
MPPSATEPSSTAPFHLLEFNIISAQDLHPVHRRMRTYAVAWVRPDRKLSTRLDPTGDSDPTWNDKFVFRVEPDFLRSETSAVMIEIYSVARGPIPDRLVGSVRVVLSHLIFSTPSSRFVALQVRRPSCRPQGIVNIGVSLLDGFAPVYAGLGGSELGYKDLMGDSKRRNQDESDRLAALATAEAAAEKAAATASLTRCKSEWEDSRREEAVLESKLDRWRNELPPIFDYESGSRKTRPIRKSGSSRRPPPPAGGRRRRSGSWCFSCSGGVGSLARGGAGDRLIARN